MTEKSRHLANEPFSRIAGRVKKKGQFPVRGEWFPMTRSRTMALAFALLCGTFMILAAFWLHAGLLKGAELLADTVKTSWSGEQIATFMQYAAPLSLIMVGLGLALMFWSTERAKKQ
ncbi:hypothetical protein [Blastomonas sp. RAC04]|uniref:hypothetical protein n=1 Tax=Blastomonas sp. RAC04 TaxID=1842535 RepID=UPI001237930E|nr:hypothetical protein [Blastomonas sp. RAC04]